MLAAVNHSGDSDSTGSLCGNLLGAAFGDDVFPKDWHADREARGILLQLADDLWFQLQDPQPTDAWFRRYPGA